jgi:hypothetical protein
MQWVAADLDITVIVDMVAVDLQYRELLELMSSRWVAAAAQI